MGRLPGRRAARAILGVGAAAVLAVVFGSCPVQPTPTGYAARPLSEIYAAIHDLADEYPQLAKIAVLGYAASASSASSATPLEGDPSLPIFAIELVPPSGSPYAVAGRPRALLLAATHGDEEIGAELALDIAAKACAAYGQGGAADLLAAADLTIVPVLNPWGYRAGTRVNYYGVDLNRNFDWAWLQEVAGAGLSAVSELESQAMVADAGQKGYALAVSLHTGDFAISLPWDYLKTSNDGSPGGAYNRLDGFDPPATTFTVPDFRSKYSPASALFDAQGMAYKEAVGSVTGADKSSFRSIEGGDWYIVCGSYGDWLYGTLGGPCYTIELSPIQSWSTRPLSMRTELIAAHEAPLQALLASVALGLTGRVADSEGNGLLVKVTATAIETGGARALIPAPEPIDYKAFALTNAEGYYRIALPAGSYSVDAISLDSTPAVVASIAPVVIGTGSAIQNFEVPVAAR